MTNICGRGGCDGHVDVIVSGIAKGGPKKGQHVEFPVCRIHAWTYLHEDGLTLTITTPGLAWCPRCDRLIAKNGQARHGYSMTWNGGKGACE